MDRRVHRRRRLRLFRLDGSWRGDRGHRRPSAPRERHPSRRRQASAWIGALVAFLILLVAPHASPDANDQRSLHSALHGFLLRHQARGAVTVLVATGLVNSWFLVGLSGVSRILTTTYGQLRLWSSWRSFSPCSDWPGREPPLFDLPGLRRAIEGRAPTPVVLAALRSSLALETGLSVAVLGLVAWLGTLAPPSVS